MASKQKKDLPSDIPLHHPAFAKTPTDPVSKLLDDVEHSLYQKKNVIRDGEKANNLIYCENNGDYIWLTDSEIEALLAAGWKGKRTQ